VVTKGETTTPPFHGTWGLKEDCKSGEARGTAAIILILPRLHIALGNPRPDMLTNGETVHATALGLVTAELRLAAHGGPLVADAATLAALLPEASAMVAERGWVPAGTQLVAATAADLDPESDEEVAALLDMLAHRSFTARCARGHLHLLFAPAEAVQGKVAAVPRLLGKEPHFGEVSDPTQWGGRQLVGAPGSPPPPHVQTLLDALAARHARDGRIIYVSPPYVLATRLRLDMQCPKDKGGMKYKGKASVPAFKGNLPEDPKKALQRHGGLPRPRSGPDGFSKAGGAPPHPAPRRRA
jgi:hypothetical protein